MCCHQLCWRILKMVEQVKNEPEEIKEPIVQVQADKEVEEAPKAKQAKPAKTKKVVQKKFAKFAKGK